MELCPNYTGPQHSNQATHAGAVLALLFMTVASAFAQVKAPMPEEGANLPAQRIGASDLIAVSVYDAPELTRTVRVGADGFVRMPMLSERIKAAGLMPAELEAAIVKALQA